MHCFNMFKCFSSSAHQQQVLQGARCQSLEQATMAASALFYVCTPSCIDNEAKHRRGITINTATTKDIKP
jgi:hypothetical protein